ncbi:MAG: rod shape-determining protein MreC [Candidatus Puniceispirillaceae bacterium]
MARRGGGSRGSSSRLSLQLILLILSFALIFIGKFDVYTLRAAKSGISNLIAPIYDVVATPVRAIETMAGGMRTLAAFRAENVRLQNENDRLKRWQRRAEILESENRQLKTVLGASATTDLTPVTARAIAAPGGSFAQTLLLEIDEGHHIKRGNAVVNADGLIGYIIEISRRTARVLLLSDVNSKIPVLLSSSSWPALVMGNNTERLSLDFLPLEAQPKIGELVLTSGHGGILPAGIPVGRVQSISENNIVITPSVAFQQISYVSVLTNQDGQTDEIDFNDLESFFRPLNPEDDKRLLEGVNAAELLQ